MDVSDLRTTPGLHALWSGVARGRPMGDVPLRPLLDTLGLGLEQTLRHLAGDRPGFDAFLDWIVTTAGPPDQRALDRYRAWHDGAPPPMTELARREAVLAEPPVFTEDDLTGWDRDGVVVLPGAISRDEAAAIAAHLWAVLGADPADPDGWYGLPTQGIMVQHFQHPLMLVPRRSRRIAKAFAELYGHADLIASTDRLGFNPPEREGHPFPGPHLHWDGSLVPPIPFETQGILYLTDTAADQGALQVVRGFHHRLADGWLDALGDADPRQVDLSADAETVAAHAGDMVIWRHEIPHGASPNRTDRPRLVQYLNLYPFHRPDPRPWR